MKTIRQNVFETNSSSTHSVTIANYGNYENLNLGDVYHVKQGEFGWEWRDYDYWQDKLSYAYTLASARWQEKYEKDSDGNILPTTKDLMMLDKVLKENLNVSEIVYEDNGGYVDHQSEDESYSSIFESENTLRDFIFNKASEFTTGNDNSDRYGWD